MAAVGLGATSGQIIAAINNRRPYDQRDRDNGTAATKTANQAREEGQIIASRPPVSDKRLEQIEHHLSTANSLKIKDFVFNRFDDPAVMKEAQALALSVFHPPPPGEELSWRVRNWVDNAKRIGPESVAGLAIRADLDVGPTKVVDFFLIKSARNNEASIEFTHETFVGLFGTNQFRGTVPNFAYIYGEFNCRGAVIDPQTKEVINWCDGGAGPALNYVLYEDITPGVDFHTYIKTCTPSQFLDKYLQILLALKAAQGIQFTHYDLHFENVIIRRLPSRATIKYGDRYLATDGVATIIDYGRCHFKIGGKDYGYYGLTSFGVLPDRYYPLHDAYKLLAWSGLGAYDANNQKVFRVIDRIMKYFIPSEPLLNIITAQEDYSFSLPHNEKWIGIPLDGLINYILKSFSASELPFVSQPLPKQLGCQGRTCLDAGQVATAVEGKSVKISNFYELLDYVNYDPSWERRLSDDFLTKLMGKQAREAGQNLNELATLAASNKNVQIQAQARYALGVIVNPRTAGLIQNMAVKTMRMFDIVQKIAEQRTIIDQLIKKGVYEGPNGYRSEALTRQIDTFTKIINARVQTMSQILMILWNNYNEAFVKQAQENDETDAVEWLYNGFTSYARTFGIIQ